MLRSANWLLKLAFTIAILGAIVAKVDFREIFATLRLIALTPIVVALVLAFLQSGVAAGRLSIVVALVARCAPFPEPEVRPSSGDLGLLPPGLSLADGNRQPAVELNRAFEPDVL